MQTGAGARAPGTGQRRRERRPRHLRPAESNAGLVDSGVHVFQRVRRRRPLDLPRGPFDLLHGTMAVPTLGPSLPVVMEYAES